MAPRGVLREPAVGGVGVDAHHDRQAGGVERPVGNQALHAPQHARTVEHDEQAVCVSPASARARDGAYDGAYDAGELLGRHGEFPGFVAAWRFALVQRLAL